MVKGKKKKKKKPQFWDLAWGPQKVWADPGHIDEGTSTTTYFLPHISRLYICTTKLKIKETMQKMKIPKNTLKFKHPKKQKQKRDHYYGMSRTLHLKLKDVNILSF